ncbi:hypothetical protein ACH40F_49375 [Streptomyces sp. NPDC020794]|uniref:hypothetical protein n=1 Tax=unclassified Streptomyces TaxID=2593676 RepID=UPI0036EABB25
MNATSSVDTPELSPLEVPDAPRGPPAQHAVDIAVRYRPARSQATGDWIDIIALPENRVGLAIGRIAGSGPHNRAAIRLLTCLYAIYDPVSRHCVVSGPGIGRPPS